MIFTWICSKNILQCCSTTYFQDSLTEWFKLSSWQRIMILWTWMSCVTLTHTLTPHQSDLSSDRVLDDACNHASLTSAHQMRRDCCMKLYFTWKHYELQSGFRNQHCLVIILHDHCNLLNTFSHDNILLQNTIWLLILAIEQRRQNIHFAWIPMSCLVKMILIPRFTCLSI